MLKPLYDKLYAPRYNALLPTALIRSLRCRGATIKNIPTRAIPVNRR